MTIVSYQFKQSRALRVMWVIAELGLDVETVDSADLFHSEQLKKLHPQGKLPAITDNGRALFESVAIVNWLSDAYGDDQFIPPSGSWERAMVDQWNCFVMTEVEAHLWTIARNTFVYPEESRSQEAKDAARRELELSLPVLEKELKGREFMNGSHFTALDINVAYVLNWARLAKVLDGYDELNRYLDNHIQRPSCPL